MTNMRAIGEASRKSLRGDSTCLTNPGYSSMLDFMRWLAALAVVTTHACWRVLVPASSLPADAPLIERAFHAINGFGHQAVIIFFVLSGYLIGGKYLFEWANDRFAPRYYLSARFARLYIVVIPALLLTGLLDVASLVLAESPGFHSHPRYDNLDARTAVLNLGMLQTFLAPTFGSNTPLWSLSFEFWFYIVFGLALIATGGNRLRWVCGASAIVVSLLLGIGFMRYAVIWILGILFASLPPRFNGIKPGYGLVVFAGTLVATRVLNDRVSQYGCDLILAMGTGALLLSLKGRDLSWFVRTKALHETLAGFSFSLYAIHYPWILFLLTLLGGPAAGSNYSMMKRLDTSSLGLWMVAVGTSVIVAWLFSKPTEQKTAVAQRWLHRNVFAARSAAQALRSH